MKLKRGDVREDGMVFWGYRKNQKGVRMEAWTTSENLDKKISMEREAAARWRRKNRDKVNESQRDWNHRNPEKTRVNSKNWYDKQDPVTRRARHKAWRDRRKAEGRDLIENPIRKMAEVQRGRICKLLRGHKFRNSLEYIGCSPEDLSRHLESKFTEGMTWENYGLHGWHVDHIVPLCGANSLDELIPLLHFSNMQPLWAQENRKKGGRV